jgi:hypothetical protein
VDFFLTKFPTTSESNISFLSCAIE